MANCQLIELEMRLQPKTLIAGVPARDLRSAFRHINYGSGSTAGFSEWLKLPKAEMQRVLDELVADGFLCVEDDRFDASKKWYSLTVRGSAVVNAHFVKPMTRARADELVAQIVERCHATNADGELLCYVQEIVVFGSYADPVSSEFGDLDLVLVLKMRPGIKDRQELIKLSQARLARSGKSGNLMEGLYYGEHEVMTLIKGRSPYISIHNADDLKLANHTKVLFKADSAGVTNFGCLPTLGSKMIELVANSKPELASDDPNSRLDHSRVKSLFENALRRHAANIMRIASNSGKPLETIRDAIHLVKTYEQYQQTTGKWPEIIAPLQIARDQQRRPENWDQLSDAQQLRFEKQCEIEWAEERIVSSALRIAAARLVGGSVEKGHSEMLEGIKEWTHAVEREFGRREIAERRRSRTEQKIHDEGRARQREALRNAVRKAALSFGVQEGQPIPWKKVTPIVNSGGFDDFGRPFTWQGLMNAYRSKSFF